MVDSNSQIDFYPHINIETITIVGICAKICPKHAILFLIAFYHFELGYFFQECKHSYSKAYFTIYFNEIIEKYEKFKIKL